MVIEKHGCTQYAHNFTQSIKSSKEKEHCFVTPTRPLVVHNRLNHPTSLHILAATSVLVIIYIIFEGGNAGIRM